MLFIKKELTGIDYNIQSLQKDLHTILCDAWGLNSKDYYCYGRVYKHKDSNGYKPLAFNGKGIDYTDVFADDKCKVMSFFGVDEKQKAVDNGKGLNADIHLIFFVDLEELNIQVQHRADEECQKEVYNLLDIGSYGFTITEKMTGIENVYREYNGVPKDTLEARSMHPKHCFRFNMKCTYDPNTVISDIDYDTNNFLNN